MWRVGVVIERMKDLPETMSLLYLFAPIYSNNSQVQDKKLLYCIFIDVKK